MKEYTKSASIHPCKLNRNDLLKLIELLKEAFPFSDRKEDFTISTNLPNISIRANSIEDFLEHEDLPDKFSRLSLEIIGWSEDREIDKAVRMIFYDNFISLDVNGAEQTWVLGKYSQIVDFLRKKRPWFGPLREIFLYTIGAIPLLSLFGLIYFIISNEIVYSISTTLLLIVWVIAGVFYFKGTFLPYTQIILRPKESPLNKENLMITIAILSLIVSLIGAVVVPLVK